jgi:hypothetical protein
VNFLDLLGLVFSLSVAAFHLQDYQTAKVALEACQALSPEQRTLASWIRKNEQELAKLPKAAVVTDAAPSTVAAAAPAAKVTPVVSAVASPASTPVPVPMTPAAHRVRYEEPHQFLNLTMVYSVMGRESNFLTDVPSWLGFSL